MKHDDMCNNYLMGHNKGFQLECTAAAHDKGVVNNEIGVNGAKQYKKIWCWLNWETT